MNQAVADIGQKVVEPLDPKPRPRYQQEKDKAVVGGWLFQAEGAVPELMVRQEHKVHLHLF